MKLTALYKYAFCALLALVGAAGLRADDDRSDNLFDVEVMPSVEIIRGQLLRRETRHTLKKDDGQRNLCSFTRIQYRSLNGKACELRVDLEKSSFNKCWCTDNKSFVPADGKWSAGTVYVESRPRGKAGIAYSYELVYDIKWWE